LFDVRQACRLVAQFTHSKTVVDFRGDLMLQSAVERQFITIGEALQQALSIDPNWLTASLIHDGSSTFVM